MLRVGQHVDISAYEAVISLCVGTGDWRAALKAFERYLEGVRSAGALPPLATFRTLVRGLQKAGQVDAAAAILHIALRGASSSSSSGAAAPSLPVADEQLCSVVLDLCAETGRMTLAETIVDAMHDRGVPAGNVTHCILVKGYGRQRRAHRVDAALRGMRRARVAPDVVTLNAAVDAYVRCGELRRAEQVVRAMEASVLSSSGGGGDSGAVAPNTRTYNTLIKGLGKAGRLDEAFATLEAMAVSGCEADSVTANSLIDACVRCGQLDRAYALLLRSFSVVSGGSSSSSSSIDVSSSGSSSSGGGASRGSIGSSGSSSGSGSSSSGGGLSFAGGAVPSVHAFTAVLSGFADAGDMARALTVLELMERSGVTANLVTYTALLGACVKAGALPEARRLFEGLRAKGQRDPALRPNTITYNTLIVGLCRLAEREEADMRQEWGGEGGVQDRADRDIMAPVCALPSGIQEALKLLLDMKHNGVAASETTINSILDGVVSLTPPRMAEAEAIRQLMTQLGLIPNSVTYSIMIKGYGRVGNLEAARAAFGALLRDPRACPDVVALNSYLDACVRCGDLPAALSTLDAAAQNLAVGSSAAAASSSTSASSGGAGSAGSSAASNNASNSTGSSSAAGSSGASTGSSSGGAGSSGGVDAAVLAAALDVRPNTVSYTTVVLGLARSANVYAGRKAMALYYEMRARGVPPDAVLVDVLLRACCNARARAGALSPQDGRRILADLRALGWDEAVLAEKAEMLSAVVPAISEVWKEGEEGGGGADEQQRQAAREPTASSMLFDKYGWNRIESRFKLF
ncbi:hypothetical protein JKP88DRAFT_319758 [Tribonema minus]|uniref:Pentacotripeptide-repeat region of PRORP domain-containing protein n=1 Tax=Tribonema minus TaxID=303371 RepID=A0A835YV31_9STRA|nr:hypothetical protein JKP88DRAFT_319758 [Tribonema minus]